MQDAAPVRPTTLLLARGARCLAAIALVLAGQELPGQEAPPTWKFVAGIGAISQPKFPGGSERMTRALPVLGAEYGRFFLGGAPGSGVPAGLGAYLYRDARWTLGAGLGADITKPRKEADSPRLRGLGDVDATPLGAVFGSCQWTHLAIRASAVTDIGGKDEGTRASLDLEGRCRLFGNLMVSAGPGATWADRKYHQTFFGVTDLQSAASGLDHYAPGGGLNTLRFTVGANLRLRRQWSLGARFTVNELQGDAASSPITEKKRSNVLGLFAIYSF